MHNPPWSSPSMEGLFLTSYGRTCLSIGTCQENAAPQICQWALASLQLQLHDGVKSFSYVSNGEYFGLRQLWKLFFNRRYCVLGSSDGLVNGLTWINAYTKFSVRFLFYQDVCARSVRLLKQLRRCHHIYCSVTCSKLNIVSCCKQ